MEKETHFNRSLQLKDASLLVIGSMIGSGIFIVSADIVRQVGSAFWLVLVWLITGIMTLTAAISYGELSAMYPNAGGQYVYLKEAYNKTVAFLYGWSFFAVIQTGTIAAVAVAFAKFTAYLFPFFSEENIILHLTEHFKISAAQLLAIGIIVLLSYSNTKGVKGGKWIQNIFTSAKLLSLFGLILAGFIYFNPEVWQQNWTNSLQAFKENANGSWTAISGTALLGGVAAAMVGSVFSSDAWNNVTFIAAEIKNPQRNIGLSLFIGTLTVTIIYMAANLMYLSVLPLEAIAHAPKDRVAVAAALQIFGNMGTLIIALMIMVSTFGCNNGLILAGARVSYTMAQDGLFFKKAGSLNTQGVPAWAIGVQAVVASILCLSGKYGDLLDMISFVVVLFYILTILGIFILRKKHPNHPRPYKAWGYPILPAIYIILGIVFCALLISFKPQFTWPGLIIVLLGVPIYYLLKRNNAASQS